MKKRFIVMLSLLLAILSVPAFAAEEPKVTSSDMAYIDFSNGNNDNNDGLTAATAKKSLLQLNANGVVSLLKDGGTMVVSGKLFIGGSYTLPKLGGTLLITSNDGTTDFNTDMPEKNPDCSLKMAKSAVFTVQSDVIIDDILLFQEYKEHNTISVKNGATLVIGEKVRTKGSTLSTDPIYMHLYADIGTTLIVKAGTYQSISGDGNIILSEGVKVIESNEPTVIDPTDAAANALYSLGLVKGYDDSGSDFRLENNLTRAESIVQIVRFLGAEAEALASSYTIPFVDVPAWAVPYIGYAYTNGITSGISATEFGPNAPITEAQFLTLLLRAMEYSDKNGDFSWSDPFALANKVGLIKTAEKAEKFVRGNAFMACYNALESSAKSGKTVGEKLIASGIITDKGLGWAKRIANGETIVVACVGDSITEGHSSSDRTKFSYPAQLQKLLGQGFKVINCGKSGAYAMNLDSPYNVKTDRSDLWYPNTSEYTKLKASKADIIIVMLGTNDARSMTEEAAQADFVSSYKALIADFASMDSNPDIYLSTMIPAVGANIVYQGTTVILPRLIRGIAEDLNLPLVETGLNVMDYYKVDLPYHDSTHPTDISYPALAINFYNEVFGHDKANLEFQKAKDKVVYVSDAGTRDNDGSSPAKAVNTLQLAVSMLRETGGTVVVCGPLTGKPSFFVECAGPVTITSVYDGVDYRKTANAKIEQTGSWTLASEMIFDDLDVNITSAGQSLNAQYNNLTIGEGVVMTGKDFTLNVGYRIGAGALSPEDVSCHKDCTIKVAGGKWTLLRGGNMRANPKDPVGTVDAGATLSIYISGGEFTNKSANANSCIGMNGCDGDAYLEISGGTFVGSVVGIHRTGTNNTDTAAAFGGNMTVKITGGTFASEFKLYHTNDTPEIQGSAKLLLSRAMEEFVSQDGFTEVEYVD